MIELKGDQIRNCSLIGQSWKVTEPYPWTGCIWLSGVLMNNGFGEPWSPIVLIKSWRRSSEVPLLITYLTLWYTITLVLPISLITARTLEYLGSSKIH